MQLRCDPFPNTAWEGNALLGEGAIWDARSDTLYWVDIKGKALHAFSPENQSNRRVELPIEVAAVAPRAAGGLVAATRDGFAILNPENGSLTFLVDPEAHLHENRFNDGAVDVSGNFVAGSMHDQETDASGTVYCLDAEGGVTTLFGGYVVCNGPAFSPDGRILYFSNSHEREILAFPYEPDQRCVGEARVFAKIAEDEGYPDGLTVDEEGFVWCAHWDGGRITRFSPDGEILRVIDLPVPRVTRCAFGGARYNELYITTACWGLNEAQLKQYPLSGSLFVVDAGIKGLPSPLFAG